MNNWTTCPSMIRFHFERQKGRNCLYLTGDTPIHRTDGSDLLPGLDVQNNGGRELVGILDLKTR